MAMNPMQRKIRNGFLLGFLLALIIAAIIAGILLMKVKGLQEEIVQLQEEEVEAMTTVYTISEDVKEGQTLTGDEKGNGIVLTTLSIPSIYVPTNAITPSNIDKLYAEDLESDSIIYSMVAKTDITQNTILTTDLVEKDAQAGTYREVQYTMISLPAKLEAGDYIDIRMKYSTGENLVVISKIKVDDVGTNSIWLTVTEGQLLLLNNAIIESYITEGTSLYATRYTNAAQPALSQTYTPNSNVTELIKENGLSDIDEEIISQGDVSREFINSLLDQYSSDEQTSSVEEGFSSEESSIQSTRDALMGDLGY